MSEFAIYAEHIVDKYGFPVAVLVWMFWRDYMVLTKLSKKLQVVIDLLGALAAQKEGK